MKRKNRESFECKEIRFRAERVESLMAIERLPKSIREQMKFVGRKEVTSKKED